MFQHTHIICIYVRLMQLHCYLYAYFGFNTRTWRMKLYAILFPPNTNTPRYGTVSQTYNQCNVYENGESISRDCLPCVLVVFAKICWRLTKKEHFFMLVLDSERNISSWKGKIDLFVCDKGENIELLRVEWNGSVICYSEERSAEWK